MKIEYPKFLYHRTIAPVIVDHPEAHDALGEGWAETPWTEPVIEPEPEPVIEPEAEAEPVPAITPEPVAKAKTKTAKG